MKYQPPFAPNFAGPVDGIYNADPNAPYKNGNPATGEKGSIPPMEVVAHPMRELVNLIEHSGQTPSHEDLEQVRKAIKKMIEEAVIPSALPEGGLSIYGGLNDPERFHLIRGLVPGTNVTLDLVEHPADSGQFHIRINAAGGGGGGEPGTPTAIENIGSGAQLHKETVANVAKLRTVKGQNGVTATQIGDEIIVDGATFGQFLPFFPEVETGDNTLSVTPSVGQVVVAPDQTFIHRGVRRINTSAASAPLRTFATAANRIYHLRWQWLNGAPAYSLKDLANVAYNPGALPEASPFFDTAYDDMLIARVVTGASNVPTVTTLRNKTLLQEEVLVQVNAVDNASVYGEAWLNDHSDPRTLPKGVVVPRNWSRKGVGYFTGGSDFKVGTGSAPEMALGAIAISRYQVRLFAICTNNSGNGYGIVGTFQA